MAGVPDSWAEVTTGDVVYLFLVAKGANEGYAMYDLTDAQYKAIESGVRLSVERQVCAFGQDLVFWRSGEPGLPERPGECRITGGPYAGPVAMTPKTFPGALIEGTAAFEAHVTASIRFVADVQHKLNAHSLSGPERRSILEARAKTMRREQAKDGRIAEALDVWPDWMMTPATRP